MDGVPTGNRRYIDEAGRRKRAAAIERASYLVEFFRSHPCADCGETDPVVLEFDARGDKLFTIGTALLDRNWQSILDEMAKPTWFVQTVTVVGPLVGADTCARW